MAAYAQGRDDAFETLYALVSGELWGFICRRVRVRAEAEDLMQRTFLHMHRARGRFRSDARVRPWMFTIAWRLIIDRARRARPEVAIEPAAHVDPRPTPHEEAVAVELGERLSAAYAQLPERQQAALELTRSAGLSQAEAAEALGTTPSAIKSLVHRALTTLDRMRGASGRQRS